MSELPDQVKHAPEYAGKDWSVREILLSVDGQWMRLTFDSGVVDFWRLDGENWKYSQTEPDFTPKPVVVDGQTDTGGGPVA
jgi:hypothetical protein